MHAQRRDDHRHHDHHQHRAEDGREDAAFGIGFARVVEGEFAHLAEIVADLVGQAHGVGAIDVGHLRHLDFHFLAIHDFRHQGVSADVGAQLLQFLLQGGEGIIQLLLAGGDVGLEGFGQLAVEFGAALLQAQLFDAMVDLADVVFFDLMDLVEQFTGALEALLQFRPGGFAGSDHGAVFLDRLQVAVEIAPFVALDGEHVFGISQLAQQRLGEPAEIDAVDIAVAQLDQQTVDECLVAADVEAGFLQALDRHFLAFADFADQADLPAVLFLVGGFRHRLGPEVAEAAHGGQAKHAGDHQER